VIVQLLAAENANWNK